MKQIPEHPDLFDQEKNKEEKSRESVQMYPPDLDVWRSTGYCKLPQSRENVLKQSDAEVLSPEETFSSVEDDLITENSRWSHQKATPEDIKNLVDVVKQATKEDIE